MILCKVINLTSLTLWVILGTSGHEECLERGHIEQNHQQSSGSYFLVLQISHPEEEYSAVSGWKIHNVTERLEIQ